MRGTELALGAMLLAGGALAGDRVVLETTEIKGNEELPKVLYVLPWRAVGDQPPATGAPPPPEPAFLEPLDPVTHWRQLRIYQRLLARRKPPAAQAPEPSREVLVDGLSNHEHGAERPHDMENQR